MVMTVAVGHAVPGVAHAGAHDAHNMPSASQQAPRGKPTISSVSVTTATPPNTATAPTTGIAFALGTAATPPANATRIILMMPHAVALKRVSRFPMRNGANVAIFFQANKQTDPSWRPNQTF